MMSNHMNGDLSYQNTQQCIQIIFQFKMGLYPIVLVIATLLTAVMC